MSSRVANFLFPNCLQNLHEVQSYFLVLRWHQQNPASGAGVPLQQQDVDAITKTYANERICLLESIDAILQSGGNFALLTGDAEVGQ